MTKKVTIYDAQTQLLELINFTSKGNEVIIVEGEKLLARLIPASNHEQPRVAGLNKGEIWVSKDFDAPLPDDFWAGPE